MKRAEKAPKRGVTFRAVLLGLLLMPGMIYWLIEMEVVRYTHPTMAHPLSNVVFTVFCVMGVNAVVKRFWPRAALSSTELLTVYLILGVVSTLCTHDLLEILVTLLPYPFQFATPENEWRDTFIPLLPDWLVISDPDVRAPFYEGESSFFTRRHLSAWIGPYLWWTGFVFALFLALLCVNTFLRKQWIERERLSYPIIQLPLEMTEPGGSFFKKRLMWLGFGIAGFISLMNLLNSIFPEVPYIPVKRQNIHRMLGLRNFGAIRVAFYPFAIGVSFLMPLDLLFSCWVFYWVYKLEIWVGRVFGLNQISGYPFADQQGFGAYMAVLAFALWTARRHLMSAFRTVFKGGGGDDEEAMPYRAAFVGLLLSGTFLALFSVRAGMSLWVFVLFFAIYFALGTIIARMRAELGFIVHDLHNIDPHGVLIDFYGTRRLGPRNLTIFALYNFFNRAYRAHPSPAQLEAFKIAERERASPRRFALALMIATLVGTVLTLTMLTRHYYTHGADTGHYGPWALGFGRGTFRGLDRWLSFPTETDGFAVGMTGFGAAVGGVMMWLRMRFLWWPLHPLGYAMSGSWGMFNLWCPLFVAWALKALILKQGGLGAYRKAVPFFLGLALGDYVFGYAWSMADVAFDRSLYQFWP